MALLENIRAFVRVAELGSLSEAGRQLRLSVSLVGHRLQQLEKHLGVRLLNRTTRKTQLTEQGAAYYEAARQIIEAVEHGEEVVSNLGGLTTGNIRVTAPLGIGRRILAPLVPKFVSLHPGIGIRVRLTDYLVDLLKEAVDVAIRLATPTDSGLVARKIVECERILCAAPSYLEANGIPRTLEDLMKHNCLLLRFPGSQQFRWTLNASNKPVTVPIKGNFDADDGDVLTAWAVAGHGIVLKPIFEVADYLQSGALRPVLVDHPPVSTRLSVVYPHRRLLAPKIKLFADFAIDEICPIVAREIRGIDVRTLAAA